MKKRRIFSSPVKSDEEINISPLIDIVFILLIFFIVSTVFQKNESLEVEKPPAESASSSPEEAITINVGKNGSIQIDGQQLSLGGIGPALHRLCKGERPVIVNADKSITAELLVRVVDEASKAGAPSVSIATQSL